MIRQLTRILGVTVGCFAIASVAGAEDKGLAATLDVFVFPADGQASDQQSRDEVECYQWAVSNAGVDPFDALKQAQAQQEEAQQQMQAAQRTGQGAGARGAVGGAAAGALIGEIADNDVGHSAAVGAAIGAIGARRRGRAAQQQAVVQTAVQSAEAQEASDEQIENFKKAFSVCLEAKDYMVKY